MISKSGKILSELMGRVKLWKPAGGALRDDEVCVAGRRDFFFVDKAAMHLSRFSPYMTVTKGDPHE